MSGLTVVIGASENPSRYSQMAIRSLKIHDEPVAAVGLKDGEFEGVKIHGDRPHFENVETITLYVGPQHQPAWFDYIISLKPKRVIFNPGTENGEFFDLCKEHKIEVVIACTLVMLSIGNY
jgi:predicted CoA-binding protein